MQPFISKKSKIRLKVLGWYQIIGGVIGLLLLIWLTAHFEQINGMTLLIILFVVGLYGFSIYCGSLLLKHKYDLGFKLSIINQAIQILQFAVLGYEFWYTSGLMVTLGISIDHGVNFGFGFRLSTFQVSIATSEARFRIAINFLAIYFLYFTERLQTSIKREKEIYEEQQLAASNSAIDDQPMPSPEPA